VFGKIFAYQKNVFEGAPKITLLAVVSELRRNHCEQTNDLLLSMREDHVMGSH
jgi:hypothetical protein